ncbi:tyrosine-protein phosphatase [Bdellovibrionota bacterium FG-2]
MRQIFPSLFFVLTLLLGSFFGGLESGHASGIAQARPVAKSRVPITDFYTVSPGIYRGARPGPLGLQALSEMGIKTILNLENDEDEVAYELQIANSLGMIMVGAPISPYFGPDDETVNLALSTLSDKENFPIFIHCQHGHDRTGLIVGLYRVEHEGVAPGAAYQEMLDLGFHPELFMLNHYFESRTGYED